MNIIKKQRGFFITPFSIDGLEQGCGFWEYAKLSETWMTICASIINTHGQVFEAPFDANLSHIFVKVTGAAGAALISLRVREHVLSSILLLSGQSSIAEGEVARLFTDSLLRSTRASGSGSKSRAFESVLTNNNRPLMVVVPWPQQSISEQDYDLVRELGLHMAGAYFQAIEKRKHLP